MRLLYILLILFLYYFDVAAQVKFDQVPNELQLYARDANSQATVVVSGTVTVAGYTKVGVQMLREGKLASVVSQTMAASLNAPFRLTSTIKAERAEYQFRVFLYKDNDSTLLADRKRVVCGDVYIIHGQSNALALAGLDTYYAFNFDDKFLRNCTYPYNSTNIPGEMRWYAAKDPYGSVGGFGMTLQRLILERYNIPTAVLNGAWGGTGIAALTARNPNNHADLNTYYGRLLFRSQWAGVARQAKAIIWKQGEDEAGNGPAGYDAKFTTFYNQLREDYGNARIYVSQINILADRVDGAAPLRDFQRRTKYLYGNVETIATVGGAGYDGIHYDPVGHQLLANEQFRQIARDIYGSTDTLQINSPDVKKTYYNARKDTITLVFEPQMQMVWKDTAYYNFATGAKLGEKNLKDYFYLDKQAGLVTGGTTSGNVVKLSLKQPVTAKELRYLPAYFSDITANPPTEYYNGPTLRNARGMRAFTFDQVPIADAIAAVSTLAGKPLSDKQIQLTWTASAGSGTQFLERADGSPTTYKQIATLPGNAVTYTDASLPDPLGTYYYRLRATSPVSESTYSNVVVARPLILSVVELTDGIVRLYPNPLSTDRLLRIEADQATISALTLRDLLGRVVKSWRGRATNELSIRLDELETGLYIAEVQVADGQIARRKVVLR